MGFHFFFITWEMHFEFVSSPTARSDLLVYVCVYVFSSLKHEHEIYGLLRAQKMVIPFNVEKWRNHQHQHRSTEFGEHLWNGHWMHFALVTVNQQVILVLSFSIDRMQALDLSSQVITLLHHPIQSNWIVLHRRILVFFYVSFIFIHFTCHPHYL